MTNKDKDIVGEKIVGNTCPRCGSKVYDETYNKLSGGWDEGNYIRATCVQCGELTFDEDEALNL